MNGGDGFITIRMYLKPLNLKMAKAVDFIFCVFYHTLENNKNWGGKLICQIWKAMLVLTVTWDCRQ